MKKFAFFGTSRFSVIILDDLKKDFDLVPSLIVTQPDKPVGRKQIITPPETKMWAEENNAKVFQPSKLKDDAAIEQLKGYDFFIVASYGKIIPQSILDLPKLGTLNVHPSLLPHYRGASPIQNQILNGEKEIGTTIMLMDAEMDHGDILAQENISFEDPFIGTYGEVEDRLGHESAKLLGKTLSKWLEGNIEAREQDHDNATYTSIIKKEDAEISLSGNDEQNYRKYLAYHDWPKVFYFEEKDGVKKRNIITDAGFENGKFRIKKIIPEGKKEILYKSD